MDADQEQIAEELRETYQRLDRAYEGDSLRRRIGDQVSAPRMRGARRSFAWWAAVAALLVMALALPRFLAAPHAGHSPVFKRVALRALPPGPVVRFDGVPVEALAAALVTHGVELSDPKAAYLGHVSRATLLRMPLTAGTLPRHLPKNLVVVVVPGKTFSVSAGWSPGAYSAGGTYHTAGVGVAVYNRSGSLLISLNIPHLSVGHMKRIGWHLRRVFWPANWRHRLWAQPWWSPAPVASALEPDARAAVATLVSVHEARRLAIFRGFVPLFDGLPANGPVWLVETPSGAAFLVDGTTGVWQSIDIASGWFPVTHYGKPIPAPTPLPEALRDE